jgi:hypothetical protein
MIGDKENAYNNLKIIENDPKYDPNFYDKYIQDLRHFCEKMGM